MFHDWQEKFQICSTLSMQRSHISMENISENSLMMSYFEWVIQQPNMDHAMFQFFVVD